MSFKSSNLGVDTGVTRSVDVLRNLARLEGDIVKISPRGYKLSNGVEYCTVAFKRKDGVLYSIQAYGKEALELHNEARMIKEIPMTMFP